MDQVSLILRPIFFFSLRKFERCFPEKEVWPADVDDILRVEIDIFAIG